MIIIWIQTYEDDDIVMEDNHSERLQRELNALTEIAKTLTLLSNCPGCSMRSLKKLLVSSNRRNLRSDALGSIKQACSVL